MVVQFSCIRVAAEVYKYYSQKIQPKVHTQQPSVDKLIATMVYIYFTAFLLFLPSFANAARADHRHISSAFDLTSYDNKVCPGGHGQCPYNAHCCDGTWMNLIFLCINSMFHRWGMLQPWVRPSLYRLLLLLFHLIVWLTSYNCWISRNGKKGCCPIGEACD